MAKPKSKPSEKKFVSGPQNEDLREAVRDESYNPEAPKASVEKEADEVVEASADASPDA